MMATETVLDCATGEVGEVPYVAPPPPVPTCVTPRQARLALNALGKLKAAGDAIATAGPDAQIEWEYATSFDRGHPLIAAIGAALSLSEPEIDDLFRDAVTR